MSKLLALLFARRPTTLLGRVLCVHVANATVEKTR